MLTRTAVAALAATLLNEAMATPLRHRQYAQSQPDYIENQYDISIQGVFNNIGGGSKAPGADEGVIIASPSTQEPNYYYTWTRDAALTMKMIVDEFIAGRSSFRDQIQLYVKTQAILQTVSNPSGALGSGRGLGEPKYYSNLTRFNGDWGRPQRDGPALRATAMITYSRWLLNTGDANDQDEAKTIWDVVQNDLNYVAQYWNQSGFDLWEEVRGSSFFTTAAQYRSLVEGAALGKKLDKDVSVYDSQAPNLLCFLQTYWNGQYMVANTNTEPGFNRTGIDANSVISVIATYDPAAGCDDALFQPCSSRALINLKTYIDSFRTIYAINKDVSGTQAVATGRYAEDVYFDGNPWYLTTLAVAEQLYNAKVQWSHQNIIIDNSTLPFWQYIYPSAQPGTYQPSSNESTTLLSAIMNTADSYVNKTLEYTPASGQLDEQYSRENGTAVSARDLTWSYAAFVTARNARSAALGISDPVLSWGAPKNPTIPGTCASDSVVGTYTPAFAAGAPTNATSCTVLVTFNLNATTVYGENMYIIGNISELGNYRTSDALIGTATKYTSARPLWNFVAELPANSVIEYQYIRSELNGSLIHDLSNRTLSVQECAGTGAVGEQNVEDAWNGPVGASSRRRSVRLS